MSVKIEQIIPFELKTSPGYTQDYLDAMVDEQIRVMNLLYGWEFSRTFEDISSLQIQLKGSGGLYLTPHEATPKELQEYQKKGLIPKDHLWKLWFLQSREAAISWLGIIDLLIVYTDESDLKMYVEDEK
jgi:hypothetical protein